MSNDTTKRINVYINSELAGANMKSLAGEVRKLKSELALLVPGTQEFIDKSKQLSIVKDRLNEVGEAINGVKEHASLFNEMFSANIAANAIEMAKDAVVEFGKESIKAYEDAQKAENNLKFITTQVNKEGIDSFNELIDQSEKLSTSIGNLYSPKTIQQAQAQLAQAKLSSEKIMEIMPLILDVAAKSGQSVEETTTLFVKGMEGSTRALIPFGAKFQDTGDRMKNLGIIVNELKGYTGGATDALGTLAGQEMAASVEAERLQEKLGSQLAPIWVGLKKDVLEVGTDFGDVMTSIKNFDIKNIFSGLGKLMKDEMFIAIKWLTFGLIDIQGKIDEANQKQTDSLKKVADAAKKITDTQLTDFVKNQLEQTKVGTEEQKKRAQDIYDVLIAEVAARVKAKDAKKKLDEETKTSEVDLTKFASAELKKRLQDLKNNDKELYAEYKDLDAKGVQMEEQRIEHLLKLRETNNVKSEKQEKKAWDKLIDTVEKRNKIMQGIIEKELDKEQKEKDAAAKKEQDLKTKENDDEIQIILEANKKKLKFFEDYAAAKAKLQENEIALANAVLNIAGAAFQNNADMMNAIFLVQKSLAIGEVIMHTAAAIQKNRAAVAGIAISNPALLAYATAAMTTENIALRVGAAASIGEIVATTIGHFTGGGIAKHAAGGMINSPHVGMVGEAGPEWIAPNWMMKKPETANIIGALESMRQQGPGNVRSSNNAGSNNDLKEILSGIKMHLDRGISAYLDYDQNKKTSDQIASIQQDAQFHKN